MLMRMVCYITGKLFAKISHVHQIVHLGGFVACGRKAGSKLPPFKTILFWAWQRICFHVIRPSAAVTFRGERQKLGRLHHQTLGNSWQVRRSNSLEELQEKLEQFTKRPMARK